jgi:predicted RNA-binding protein with PUA-like domain
VGDNPSRRAGTGVFARLFKLRRVALGSEGGSPVIDASAERRHERPSGGHRRAEPDAMPEAPAHWLVKSEPVKYAFSDLERDGRTVWDGVRNNQAAIYLRTMKVGDQAFYYHSQEGLAVVGVAEVVKEWFPDPTDAAGRFAAVEFAPVRPLPKPVTLAQIKANPALAGMTMLRLFRLSVTPITPDEWRIIREMGGDV